MKNVIAIGLLACAAISGANAAGFDCSKASTNVERRICANPELDALDTELNQVYKKVSHHAQVKESQREWIRDMRNVAGSDDAMVRAYEYRIADIKNFQAEQRAREEIAAIEAAKPVVKPVEQPKKLVKVDSTVVKEIKGTANLIAGIMMCEKKGFMHDTKDFRDAALEDTKKKMGSKYSSEIMKTEYKKELSKMTLVSSVSPGEFMQLCNFYETGRQQLAAENEMDDMDF